MMEVMTVKHQKIIAHKTYSLMGVSDKVIHLHINNRNGRSGIFPIDEIKDALALKDKDCK